MFYRSLSCHCNNMRPCTTCYEPVEIVISKQTLLAVDQCETNSILPLDWVAVVYGAKWFLGEVQESMSFHRIKVSYMEQLMENSFRWPARLDIDNIDSNTVLCRTKIPTVHIQSKFRQHYCLTAEEYHRITTLFDNYF